MKKTKVPNVVRGGVAIPLGRNYYYMQGRSHEQGGIDIGKNPRTGLEVEGGEVVHVGNREMRVFSAQPFITNGVSPAQRVMRGENPNKVFNAQEAYKRRNKLNDDGTKKKRMGGDDIQYIYNKVNKKNTPDFIRMRNPKRKSIPDWRNNKYTSTNKVAVGTDSKGQVYLYNDIQDDGKGGLIDMSNPKNYKNGRYMGQARAEERGDTIHINSIQDGLLFSEDYKNYYPGFPKTKRMGGLSRSKDYGSKSKPYPKVKSGDFAGGHRSYPIPTKADARDALRLAGLHGRNDVKAKVYKKYPELKKSIGGTVSINGNVVNKLLFTPFSTGGRKKAVLGTKEPDKYNPIVYNDSITPIVYGLPSSGIRRRVIYPNKEILRMVENSPNGINPIKLATSGKMLSVNPLYQGNDMLYKYSSTSTGNLKMAKPAYKERGYDNPSTFRIDTTPYAPYQWDDNQFAITRQTINKAATNRALRGNLNNSGYDPIEEGILQIRELGTGQSGTPEGFQWSGYTDAAASNPNLNYQSDASNKRLRQWGFNPGIIERVGNINLTTPIIPTTETPTTDTSATPVINARPAGNSAALARRGKTASLPTVSMPNIIKGNININEGIQPLNIPIPTSVSSAPTPNSVPVTITPTRSRERSGNNILRRAIDWAKNNPDTAMDALSLVSNVGLATAGFLQNRRFLNRMQYAPQPYAKQAAKLKTRINIEPQLDKMRESLAEYERNVRGNTASSRVALARQQRARLKNIMDTNELYGTKENLETQLINKDRLNQQAVTNSNIEDFNKWRQGKAEFRNKVNEAKAENIAAYINAINSGVQDVATRVQKRNSEKRTNKAMMLANPNLPAEMLLSSGLITQDMYDEYRKAYPLKKRK